MALPAGAGPPFRVYVNGEERVEGEGFAVEGGRLRFTPPLRAQPPLGLGRKVLLGIGIGVYGDLKGDTLDRPVPGRRAAADRDDPAHPGRGRGFLARVTRSRRQSAPSS